MTHDEDSGEPPPSAIERLFDLALTCEPSERAAFLERACSDLSIRREVESLLEADQQAQGFLEPRAWSAYAPGERIGPYVLIRKLSDGETSSVYLAMREDGQYRQSVAIKLIRPGVESNHVLQRFRQERQILASLIHPNIARLLDGGSTPMGQPYLVMEYVDGEPLDAYCRKRNLPLAARLELFITVCQAVHFAHSSLVVHRDLKPSNILVGADGTPKLLDFGIAKLLDPDRVGVHVELTATAARVMTPNYASPEQVLGKPIGTGSDVYSLGVVLYELLTGRKPYELRSRSLRDIERIVCDSTPPLPSQLVRESRRERLPRDLDNIVLMAMRKEPQRRYASAQELGADVRRCLERRPVQAQRDTLSYVVSSFVRRHLGAVAAAAAIVLLLIGGVVATTWQWRQAVGERTRAETQQRAAEQTLAFLVDLFKVPGSRVAMAEVSARDVLEHGVTRLRNEPRRSLGARAALEHALGVVYSNLGEFPRAAALLEQAIAMRSQSAGGLLELADSLHQLGLIEAENSDPTRAIARLWSALVIRTQLLGGDHPLVADVLEDLSRQAVYKLPFAAAVVYLRRAVEIRRRDPATDKLQLSASMAHLAQLYSFSGHHDEADAVAREAVTVRNQGWNGKACRDGDGELFNDLALWRAQQGYFEESERLLDAASDCLRRQLGPEHPNVVDLSALRVVLWREQGRYADAEKLALQSLDQRSRAHGDASPAVHNAQHILARVLYERGKLSEAAQMETLALRRRMQSYGPIHDAVASSRVLLGDVQLAGGDAATAEVEFRGALDIWKRTGNEHPEAAIAWRSLARALLAQRRIDAARAAAQISLELQRRRLRPMHPEIAKTVAVLGDIAEATSPAAAEPLFREALRILRLELAASHPYHARVEVALGQCLVRQGRMMEAIPLLRHGAQVLRSSLGEDHPDARRAAASLAAVVLPAHEEGHEKP